MAMQDKVHADAFSECHPLLNFFYFGVVLVFTMFNQHPVFLGVSYAGAVAYSARIEKNIKTKLSYDTARASDRGTSESDV